MCVCEREVSDRGTGVCEEGECVREGVCVCVGGSVCV